MDFSRKEGVKNQEQTIIPFISSAIFWSCRFLSPGVPPTVDKVKCKLFLVICFCFYRTLNFHHLTFFVHHQKKCLSKSATSSPTCFQSLYFSYPQANAMIQKVLNISVSSLKVWLSLFKSDFICVLSWLGFTLTFPLLQSLLNSLQGELWSYVC